LPDFEGRLALIKRALRNERNTLSEDDFKEIAQKTEGYSGSDLYGLCQGIYHTMISISTY
jgi:SpoVK/Ycf46/Vps4 family AAA+-type ATPase